jgi:hypothetical protein
MQTAVASTTFRPGNRGIESSLAVSRGSRPGAKLSGAFFPCHVMMIAEVGCLQSQALWSLLGDSPSLLMQLAETSSR